MRRGLSLLGAAGLAAVLASSGAYAVPIAANGSFGFVPTGTTTVNTTNITTATSSKTLPTTETINTITTPFMAATNNLGLTLGGAVTLGYYTIPVPPLMTPTTLTTPLTITVPTSVGGGGSLVFTYTTEETTALAGVPGGNLALLFEGTLTSAPASFFITGSTAPADLSESCTQAAAGGTINCSDTVDIPPVAVIHTPEPASLALLGSALFGFGVLRRRRKAS